MHYGKTDFSKAPYNLTTIRTLDPAYQDAIGQRRVISRYDVEKVNTLYNCGESQSEHSIIVTTTNQSKVLYSFPSDCEIIDREYTRTKTYYGTCSIWLFSWRCIKEE